MTMTSPKMFAPSSLPTIDVSQLCFNKAHFTRSDFDVHRFMMLARRRSDLKRIHEDLRLYFKSIQHSMVELINEDYAHFVNLSSNLAGLKTSIDGIHNNIDSVWKEFNETAKDAVSQAEKIEERCSQLAATRDVQQRLRRQITAVSAIKKLKTTLRDAPSPLTVIWLERLSSLLTDLIVNVESLEEDSAAKKSYNNMMDILESKLTTECLSSLKGNVSLLPLLFSLVSLCGISDRLVSRIVSDVIDSSIQRDQSKTPLQSLNNVLDQINKIRATWSNQLGEHSKGSLMNFLDESLLTFLLSYIDKSLSTHLTTSPTLFHSAFGVISRFINEWPSQCVSSSHLRSIRSRFQLQVYFLQVSSAPWKKLHEMGDPCKFALAEREEDEDGEMKVQSMFAHQAINTVKGLWSDDRFLLPLAGKCWEQTTKILALCINYPKVVTDHVSSLESSQFDFGWSTLTSVCIDCHILGQLLFDHALLHIWPRLRELNIDTSKFGQTMNAFTASLKREADCVKEQMIILLTRELDTLMDGVSQLPKQYRWTKKPLPQDVSSYMNNALSRLDKAIEESKSEGLEGIEDIGREVMNRCCKTLLNKAQLMLETVNATGVSLSRLKRREGAIGMNGEGEIKDEDKIRMQLILDLSAILNKINENGDEVENIQSLINTLQTTNSNRQPSV